MLVINSPKYGKNLFRNVGTVAVEGTPQDMLYFNNFIADRVQDIGQGQVKSHYMWHIC